MTDGVKIIPMEDLLKDTPSPRKFSSDSSVIIIN